LTKGEKQFDVRMIAFSRNGTEIIRLPQAKIRERERKGRAREKKAKGRRVREERETCKQRILT
jgi:hypothetical protein